jgi:hypothetical protein
MAYPLFGVDLLLACIKLGFCVAHNNRAFGYTPYFAGPHYRYFSTHQQPLRARSEILYDAAKPNMFYVGVVYFLFQKSMQV